MTDPNEIAALKASYRGAVATAEALSGLKDRIEGLDPGAAVSVADLEEIARITAAHAIASNALRGLVDTMLRRRGAA